MPNFLEVKNGNRKKAGPHGHWPQKVAVPGASAAMSVNNSHTTQLEMCSTDQGQACKLFTTSDS